MYANVCACRCDHTKLEFGEFERSDVIITAWNKRFYHESHHSFERRNCKDRKSCQTNTAIVARDRDNLEAAANKCHKTRNRIKLCN